MTDSHPAPPLGETADPKSGASQPSTGETPDPRNGSVGGTDGLTKNQDDTAQ